MNKGLLIVLSGPSGTGKGTVCKQLLEQEKNLFLSISSTSREIRPGEEDGVTYHYTTPECFQKLIEEEKMMEWAVYNGNYYGTPKDAVEKRLSAGEDVLLEIDVQGAMKIKEQGFGDVFLFLLPPSMEELRKRLVERGRESKEQIQKRLDTVEFEIGYADKYDYVVVNDKLDDCVEAITEIIHAEKKKTKRNQDLIERVVRK